MKTEAINNRNIDYLTTKIEEIESKIDEVLSSSDELSYLDKVKANDLFNQIQKIYLKYAPIEKQKRVQQLKDEIRSLLYEEDLDVYRYSKLDYELKKELKSIKKPHIMSNLDRIRVDEFNRRIENIYRNINQTSFDFTEVEKLISKKEKLLNLI